MKALPAIALVLAFAQHAAAATHVVKIEGMKFDPPSLTVRAGDKVTWQNNDLVPHTATAAGRFDSREIAAGRSWTWTADRAGSMEYVCTYHPGMKARLEVR